MHIDVHCLLLIIRYFKIVQIFFKLVLRRKASVGKVTESGYVGKISGYG